MIIADTGAIVALIDARDRHHRILARLFAENPDAWILPWAILPEVDYLLSTHVGARAQQAFLNDVAAGAFAVEWSDSSDLERSAELNERYKALKLGLVDGVVIAMAERLHATAIATLDVRDFGAVRIAGGPKLIPRDLE